MCAWSRSLPSCWRSSPQRAKFPNAYSRLHLVEQSTRALQHFVSGSRVGRADCGRFAPTRRHYRHQASKLTPLSTPPAGVFRLPGFPEAVRTTSRLRRVSSAPSAPTPKSLIKSGLNSTASITASSMTLTHSSRLSASKPQRNNGAAREQNPHHSHYNGLIHTIKIVGGID